MVLVGLHCSYPGRARSHQQFSRRLGQDARNFLLVSMTSAEDAVLCFHPASVRSEWRNSAVEEFPPRFMACDVIFENFKRNYLKVRKHLSVQKDSSAQK